MLKPGRLTAWQETRTRPYKRGKMPTRLHYSIGIILMHTFNVRSHISASAMCLCCLELFAGVLPYIQTNRHCMLKIFAGTRWSDQIVLRWLREEEEKQVFQLIAFQPDAMNILINETFSHQWHQHKLFLKFINHIYSLDLLTSYLQHIRDVFYL